MRQGFSNEILHDIHGNIVGINFGSDHCAEHEWGVSGICGAFDVTGEAPDTFGLDRRRIHRKPPALQWIEGTTKDGRAVKKWAGMWLPSYEDARPEEIRPFFYPGSLFTGWSGSNFGAFSVNPKEQTHIKTVLEAIERLDACVWLGGGGPFKNAGFIIGIISRIDPKWFKSWDEHDRAALKLKQDFAATGIEEKLRLARKTYFAMKPRREPDGSISVWLNASDRYGWFTIKDLEDWITGTGPVVKARKAAL